MARRRATGARSALVALIVIIFAVLGAWPNGAGVTAKAVTTMADHKSDLEILASAGPVALGDRTVRVALPNKGKPSLAARLSNIPGHRSVQLVLSGMTARRQPGVIFRVYFSLQPQAPLDDAHFIDTINFYSAVTPAGAQSKLSDKAVFDITQIAARISAESPQRSEPALVFVPGGKVLPGSEPRIESLQLIEE